MAQESTRQEQGEYPRCAEHNMNREKTAGDVDEA